MSFKTTDQIHDQISNPCEVLPTVYAVSTWINPNSIVQDIFNIESFDIITP
jgi:hypothetical protein